MFWLPYKSEMFFFFVGISCKEVTVLFPLSPLFCLSQWSCVFSPNVSPRLFVRALIPCSDDIMVSAQPISFRELKLTVPVAQQHENNAANVKRGGGERFHLEV